MSTETSRRALLAGAAAMPALAVPAIASDAVFDRQAALARLEHIVNVLRTSYVRDGWRLDEARAASVLANFDDDDTVIEWVIDHNQSLDWVFRGEPGSMICRFASNSTAAAAPDPIFSAIEQHKAAVAAM